MSICVFADEFIACIYCIERAKKFLLSNTIWWRFAYKHTNTVRQGFVIVIICFSICCCCYYRIIVIYIIICIICRYTIVVNRAFRKVIHKFVFYIAGNLSSILYIWLVVTGAIIGKNGQSIGYMLEYNSGGYRGVSSFSIDDFTQNGMHSWLSNPTIPISMELYWLKNFGIYLWNWHYILDVIHKVVRLLCGWVGVQGFSSPHDSPIFFYIIMFQCLFSR